MKITFEAGSEKAERYYDCERELIYPDDEERAEHEVFKCKAQLGNSPIQSLSYDKSLALGNQALENAVYAPSCKVKRFIGHIEQRKAMKRPGLQAVLRDGRFIANCSQTISEFQALSSATGHGHM